MCIEQFAMYVHLIVFYNNSEYRFVLFIYVALIHNYLRMCTETNNIKQQNIYLRLLLWAYVTIRND